VEIPAVKAVDRLLEVRLEREDRAAIVIAPLAVAIPVVAVQATQAAV
jgi:hypothetical protein